MKKKTLDYYQPVLVNMLPESVKVEIRMYSQSTTEGFLVITSPKGKKIRLHGIPDLRLMLDAIPAFEDIYQNEA